MPKKKKAAVPAAAPTESPPKEAANIPLSVVDAPPKEEPPPAIAEPPPPAVDVLPLYDCSPARRFIASPHFAICKAILNELIYGRTQLRFSDTVVFYQSEKRGL